ncbi:MAG TPA: GDSL-type esterase/lipase family protein, partial [Pirellulales bacterium]
MKATRWFSFFATIGIALTLASKTATLAADDAKATAAAPAASSDAAADAESGKHFATTPAIHNGTTAKIDRINERAKQGDVDLLFLGDSITDNWQSGANKDVWNKYYGNRKAMNAGIGGDLTQHVLWRLDHGNIDGIKPKLCVLMIGTNNTGNNTPKGKEYTAEDIA